MLEIDKDNLINILEEIDREITNLRKLKDNLKDNVFSNTRSDKLDYEMTYKFFDSLIKDKQLEYQRRLLSMNSGLKYESYGDKQMKKLIGEK